MNLKASVIQLFCVHVTKAYTEHMIDNQFHGSGYLGMARCFNIQGNLVVKTYQLSTHFLIWVKQVGSNELYLLLLWSLLCLSESQVPVHYGK